MAIDNFDTLLQGLEEEELIPSQSPLQREVAPVIAPQQGIGGLEASLARLQGLTAQKQAALQEAAAASSATPGMRFANDDRSAWESLKDPTKSQRSALIHAGLALAASNPTNSLSQRIGQALGSGVTALEKGRQKAIDKKSAEARLKFQMLGIDEEAEKQNFTLREKIVEERRLAKGTASTKISDMGQLIKERDRWLALGTPEGDANARLTEEAINALRANKLALEDYKYFVDDFKVMEENANKTSDMFLSADRAEKALSKATTGAGAEAIYNAKRFAKLFGVTIFNDDIEAHEAVSQVLGANVLELLSSGVLGSGTGLSDKDVEFARKVAAGTIILTEENIKYAIDAQRRAANYIRQRYNKGLAGGLEAYPNTGFASRKKGTEYEILPFTPISAEGRALFGNQPSALQGGPVISPTATGLESVSDEDLLLGL